MRVGYLLPEDIPLNGTSGASAHVRSVIDQLEQRGHSVRLVSRFPNSEELVSNGSSATPGFVRSVLSSIVPDVAKTLIRDWLVRRKSRQLVEKHAELLQNSDVIYERDAYQSFGVQAVNTGTPWVLECNGIFWDEQSPFSTPVWRDRYRWRHVQKWKQADHLIVVSDSFKEHVVGEGIAPDKVTVIHNGVDVEPHRNVTTSEVQSFRKKWGVDESTVLGFLGHMLPWHRIDMLVDAIRQLREGGYEVKGLLVGGGRWKKYRRYAEENNAGEGVVFTGPVPPTDVPVAVAAMDICTVPGIYEPGSPVKLFDYGAAGRPIVAANAPSVTEIITDEENGLLFEEGSLEGFVGAVTRLLENDERRDQLGSAIRNKVEEEHTWENVGRRTESVLNRVLETSRN